MRIQMMEVPAKELVEDVFIYLPIEQRFIFVDDIDHTDGDVIVYFEPDFDDEIAFRFDEDEMIQVVSEYNIVERELAKKILGDRFNDE